MEITPDKKKLALLVEKAYEGSLCLPNFQRDFVWSKDAIADLIRSILRGYFLGSLLLLDCDPKSPPFAPIALRGAKPKTVDLRPTQLVLDGQQRLTSLLYAMHAPDLGLKGSRRPRRFFLDLELLTNDLEDDGIVFALTDREIKKEGLGETVSTIGLATINQLNISNFVTYGGINGPTLFSLCCHSRFLSSRFRWCETMTTMQWLASVQFLKS